MKRVRMLVDRMVDGLQYRSSQVVDFPDHLAKPLIADGGADDHKDAVAYCVNELKAPVLVHESEAERAAKEANAATRKKRDDLAAAVKAEKDAGRKGELKRELAAAEAALAGAKGK